MEKSYEEKLIELEGLVTDLENKNISLDESINKYKKALELSKELKDMLDKAKLEIEIKE